jgi:hypothetical protein
LSSRAEWVRRWGARGGYRFKLTIYHICIKTMSVKGGAYAHEAYEAKKKNCYVNT